MPVKYEYKIWKTPLNEKQKIKKIGILSNSKNGTTYADISAHLAENGCAKLF